MKTVDWVYDKRGGEYIINFDRDSLRLYFDWFIRIRNKQLVAGINQDTLEWDYESH